MIHNLVNNCYFRLTPKTYLTLKTMTLVDYSEIREVHEISPEEKKAILNFLQGAVYCWCKNRPDEWFGLRDLMGGENYYWQGTPLFVLFEKQTKKGKAGDKAVSAAARDGGWLLKKVIHSDIREFDTKIEELIRKYRWVGDK